MISPNMYFRRKAGEVQSAWPQWNGSAPFAGKTGNRRSAAQRAGLRYEAKALKHLDQVLPLFLSHLPFCFLAEYGAERCIPDGVAISSRDRSLLTLIEIKHRHSADAWFQLKYLYWPVVRAAFPRHRIQLLEVCGSYDPAVNVPDRQTYVDDLLSYVEKGGEQFAVYPWSGKF